LQTALQAHHRKVIMAVPSEDDIFCAHGYGDHNRCLACKNGKLVLALQKAVQWCDLQIKHPGCSPGPKELKASLIRALDEQKDEVPF